MFTNVTVTDSGIGRRSGGRVETLVDRKKRIDAFWKDPSNAVIFYVGRLLALLSGEKNDSGEPMTYADMILAGRPIQSATLPINGIEYPLQAGFSLSLLTVVSTWGCFACHSAHGSGVHPSKTQDKKNLEKNEFFYNPSTGRLFVVSDTCRGDYMKAYGGNAHVLSAPQASDDAAIADLAARFPAFAAYRASLVPATPAVPDVRPVPDAPDALPRGKRK